MRKESEGVCTPGRDGGPRMSLPGLSDPGNSRRVFPLSVLILHRQTPSPKASRNWGSNEWGGL